MKVICLMFMRTERYLLPLVLTLAGIVLTAVGLNYKSFRVLQGLSVKKNRYIKRSRQRILTRLILYITGIPILKVFRNTIAGVLAVNSQTTEEAEIKSSYLVLAYIGISAFNIVILKDIGSLWYTKVLTVFICMFLPYYIITLVLDLMNEKINKQVPGFIDEFRGAFLNEGRVKPALLESANITGGSLGNLVKRAVMSTDTSLSLAFLKKNINNIWFGVFIQLLINYKNNGGQLVDQLYRLNKTMVLYNNLEKKKSKRLIWYEIFAVTAAFISIPAIYWVNYKILGSEGFIASATQSNVIVSKVIGLSAFSLVVIRILRRL